ncbi:MAG TPA: FkbM family methyltransferase [Cyclobacteriaceae bacterium]|nr:FkbM family methyltransferase [Cyclobacteriaceae bacterium]
MKLLIPLKYIYHHPLTKDKRFRSFARFLYWQTISRIRKEGIQFNWIHGARLFLKRGMHGATGSYYAYLHDFQEMSFLLHFLNKGDVFWDIGANVGSYTILASKVAGARVVAFEPVPMTYEYLKKNIALNDLLDRAMAFNIGLSDSKGNLNFTRHLDTVNHVVVKDTAGTIQVEVDTCDSILQQTESVPSIIKLDVEGYELPVLKGADTLLRNHRLQSIIIELNGLGKRFGFQDDKIHEVISRYGFLPYAYLPFERKLEQLTWPFQTPNIIYCRDIAAVQQRLKEGMLIETPGFKF